MKNIAIQRASEHLESAKAVIADMNLDNGHKAYERAWSQFLSQASRFYSKLEQGAKGCKQSEPWFGKRKHERKNDPLMSYLHHARDCDEHGLEYVVAETGSQLTVRMKEGASEVIISSEVMVDSFGKVHVRNPQTKTPEAITEMELRDPRMELVAAKDSRYRDTFEPPVTHLHRPIVDRSPLGVATLAVQYMTAMLAEASKLPKHV